MTENRRQERELVLAPNEYAYVQDTTKGHINCYVGPNKTSLAQTDQPVSFNPNTQRFDPVEISAAVKLFATAPANWYIELQNPGKDDAHPLAGTSNGSIDLRIGEKVNVPGPVSFPLWPGQLASVIEGHRLQSNEYLYVRIHDAQSARASWSRALGREDEAEPTLETGQKLVIRGTDVSFYVPPTGVEVIPDQRGRYVRKAATLQRLEYCVLIGEDGKKQYVRGEAVVFPRPSERFMERNGQRVFRAIELSEITGIYVKVIAPYAEADGTERVEGEELFITGKNVIYFPREEHAIIRYGTREVHQALAIPKGEGRYVLDRITGEVSLVVGPRMFLPDPRRQVLIRRQLSRREQRLFGGEAVRTSGGDMMPEPSSVPTPQASTASDFDSFERPEGFEGPREITLDDRSRGAVSIDVWSGHAIQVVDRSGGRRVVVGPDSVLLEYDETLEALNLSTGVPKSRDARVETAFLRIWGNKVSDEIDVVSSDAVACRVRVEYRVSFEADDPSRWFRVEDYVKLLCDHAGSVIKAAVRKVGIQNLRSASADIVRSAVLGAKTDQGRLGMRFEDNGMRVFEVEVLDLDVLDDYVDELLDRCQAEAMASAIEVAHREAAFEGRQRIEAIERALSREAHETSVHRLQLDDVLRARAHEAEQSEQQRRAALAEAERALAMSTARSSVDLASVAREQRVADHEMQLAQKREHQVLMLDELAARVEGTVRQAQAFTPQLVSAIHRLGDQQLLGSLAGNFGELAAIEGRGLLEVAQKFLDFIPSTMVPQLTARSGTGDDE